MTFYFLTKLSENTDKQPCFEVFWPYVTAQIWLFSQATLRRIAAKSFSLETAPQRQHSYGLGKVNSHVASSKLTASEKSA